MSCGRLVQEEISFLLTCSSDGNSSCAISAKDSASEGFSFLPFDEPLFFLADDDGEEALDFMYACGGLVLTAGIRFGVEGVAFDQVGTSSSCCCCCCC